MTLSGALTSFNLPLEAVGVILGVDAVMDMARTSLNLLGNRFGNRRDVQVDGTFDTETVPDGVSAPTGAYVSSSMKTALVMCMTIGAIAVACGGHDGDRRRILGSASRT